MAAVDGYVLRRVFLRKVLYRIDYQLITEDTQENIFKYIAETYGDYFPERSVELLNPSDFSADSESRRAPKLNAKPQEVYCLTWSSPNGKESRTIQIGRTFCLMNIKLDVLSEYVPYYNMFGSIVGYLNSIEMFSPVRVGLRKFNTFYHIKDSMYKLDSIFQIPFYEESQLDKFRNEAATNLQVYTMNQYVLRYTRGFSTGILNAGTDDENDVRKIEFDFDLYSTSDDVLSEFCENAEVGLKYMNDCIYEFFKTIIQPDIVLLLNEGDLLEGYGVIPL